MHPVEARRGATGAESGNWALDIGELQRALAAGPLVGWGMVLLNRGALVPKVRSTFVPLPGAAGLLAVAAAHVSVDCHLLLLAALALALPTPQSTIHSHHRGHRVLFSSLPLPFPSSPPSVRPTIRLPWPPSCHRLLLLSPSVLLSRGRRVPDSLRAPHSHDPRPRISTTQTGTLCLTLQDLV